MPGTGLSESMPTTPTSRSRPYSDSAGDMSGSDGDTSFPFDSKPHHGTASEKDAALESPSIGELLRLNSHSKSHAPPPPPSLNFIENTQYNPASSIANGLAAHMSVRPPTTPTGKGGDLDRSAIDAISVGSASTPLYIYKVIAEPGEFHTLEFVEGDNHEPICFRWYSSWLQQEYEVDVGIHTTKINHAWRDQFCLAGIHVVYQLFVRALCVYE
ncbi:hypothetical protein SARC_10315 [Sphaeroforma arctica JP610]|uniref:Uncharacterized protein n=1 Tax=Sphaeroforma arctica JP610 TaxID=667725 RepID=A0A0L0FL74_9EUKA|nr:hypothetical protein SARC_10315 [Sphaeroforma arctica JP610]KNC77221.1 hypothetical protein SARC_10315 [Sphaeroforma arctica JP610]|eukprot:XP_014151123.1 hypothetical protein SARC_10315 [Sphaeroforma arctica JP610]